MTKNRSTVLPPLFKQWLETTALLAGIDVEPDPYAEVERIKARYDEIFQYLNESISHINSNRNFYIGADDSIRRTVELRQHLMNAMEPELEEARIKIDIDLAYKSYDKNSTQENYDAITNAQMRLIRLQKNRSNPNIDDSGFKPFRLPA